MIRSRNESEAAALFGEGAARMRAGFMIEAASLMERAFTLAPDLPGLAQALMTALRRDARYEDGLALAERILVENSNDIDARFEKAMNLVRLGEAQAALDAFDAVTALKPDHAAAWFQSHGPALDLHGLDDALERLDRAASQYRANGRYRGFAHAYRLLAGRNDEACERYRRDLARHPNRRIVSDGVRALLDDLAPGFRLFGVSAHLLRFALDRAQQPGLVLEFGVRRGASLRHIAAAAGQTAHGFDSFAGLPENWGIAPLGALSTGLSLPEIDADIRLYPGWFEETLPAFLADHAGDVRFANIDSDLYSSARTVLTALAPRIVAGSVLVFDEMIGNPSWRDDEYKAFREFEAETGTRFEIIAIAPLTKQVAVRRL